MKLNNHHSDLFEERNKLIRIIELILRQKWSIIITFVLVVSVVSYFTLKQRKVYAASASVIVELVNISSGAGIRDFSGTAARNLQNELEILKSRALRVEVAKKLLNQFYVDPETQTDTISLVRGTFAKTGILDPEDSRNINELAGFIAASTSFDIGKEMDIIVISASSFFPEQAALLANLYAETYYERDLKRSRMNATDIREFLEEQNANRLGILEQSEREYQRYMESENVSELADRSKFLIMKITDLESEIESNEIEYRKTNLLFESYQNELNVLVPTITEKIVNVDDLYIKELQKRIAQEEAELDVSKIINRADSLRPEYIYEVSRAQNTIDSLRSILQERTNLYLKSISPTSIMSRDGLGSTSIITNLTTEIQQLQLKLETLSLSQNDLRETLAKYERDFEKLPRQQVTLAKLKREKEFNEKLYLKMGEQYQEALLAELSTFGRVEILDRAVVPQGPVGPRVVMNIMIGAILGLVFGVFVAFALDFFFHYVRSPHDVESLGYRLISTIPKLPVNGGAMKLLGSKKDKGTRQLLEVSTSNILAQESYQRLQIYLTYGFLDKKVKSLVVSSAGPGEGKSSTAANLAVSLARSGKKVLLVDMDMRKPVAHKFFNLPQSPSLVHYLYKKCGLSEVIKKSHVEGLHVITAIEFNQNPALILTSSTLHEFMERMKEHYDFIIYDTPPVNAVTDAVHLARIVDETILIARSDQTNVDELNRAAKLFEQFSIKIGGVVLNDFDDAKLPSYYGRYYGFYTKDGKKIKTKKKPKVKNSDVVN